MNTAYSITRAISTGMNLTFAGRGYAMAARRRATRKISGALESMHSWSKNMAWKAAFNRAACLHRPSLYIQAPQAPYADCSTIGAPFSGRTDFKQPRFSMKTVSLLF
jgi:hypothetical protein